MAPESTFCNLGADLLHLQVMEQKPALQNAHPGFDGIHGQHHS